MTTRRGTRIMVRAGAVLATTSLAVAGVALTAAPAQATGSEGECPPATSPPSAHTWIDPQTGAYRGVRKISDERGPVGKVKMWSIQQYETFGHDYHQRETWDVDMFRGATRTDCTRKEHDPEPPAPRGRGGGGGGTSGIGGGSTLWMISPSGGDEVRYGHVGEVEPL